MKLDPPRRRAPCQSSCRSATLLLTAVSGPPRHSDHGIKNAWCLTSSALPSVAMNCVK